MSDCLTIDCDYVAPGFAASYLLTEGDEAAFVEANTAHALPRLLAALGARRVDPSQVRWIFVTHVHLDHAGGASALMEACPGATLLCHPRAAPHLVDPAKLVAGARRVYGDAAFERLYGDIRPIDPARVRAVADGETLRWGSRAWTFLHTRGHANHHACLFDDTLDGTFTGDTFGVRYPRLQRAGLFVLPSTSPTDFDAEAALASVDRLERLGRRAFPTHFGEVGDLRGVASQLREQLTFAGRLVDEAAGRDDDPEAFCRGRLDAFMEQLLARRGLVLDEAERSLLGLDLRLNAQGVAHAARRRREGR
jgi:glyoxylase-like metal-dependent hydrolase (beta-lactamase superfamily II)